MTEKLIASCERTEEGLRRMEMKEKGNYRCKFFSSFHEVEKEFSVIALEVKIRFKENERQSFVRMNSQKSFDLVFSK